METTVCKILFDVTNLTPLLCRQERTCTCIFDRLPDPEIDLRHSTVAVLSIEIGAAGTSFAASQAARSAFETLFTGHRWMIFYNSLTAVLHWDFVRLPLLIQLAEG